MGRVAKKRMWKSALLISVVGLFAVLGFGGLARADFDSSNLISDGTFVNINKLDTGAIQRFLESKGSFLKDYSEGGRSAAQIIRDAAHGYGDASGSINGIDINTSTGTVNPQVILVTLQKEQSLITKTSRDDNALNKAMGYACPDAGGCNPAYAGFTKQVENGAWQLRYNYERASGHGFSDYQVGQGFCFDDWNGTHCGTFGNRATASLYRYTPHVYNGNYNFWNLFNSYFSVDEYSYVWVTQNVYPTLDRGQSYNFQLTVRNTGTATWQRGAVNLATSHGKDRISAFTREGDGPSGWISGNRIMFQESSVAPGATATYSFWMRNDSVGPGHYREFFQLVADNITWMEDYGIYWEITVPSEADKYHHSWVSQNVYPTLDNGQAYNFQVTVRNTGSATWRRGAVNLATSHGKDRISAFTREGDGPSGWISGNRIMFQESSVAPGATATYSFWMKNNGLSPGTYREHFQLVADNITWMEDYGIYWDVTVPGNQDKYRHQWVTQNVYPTLNRGQSYNFQVTVRNTGTATWNQGQVNLGTSHSRDRISAFTREGDGPSGWISPDRIAFQESSVAPGATATYSFWMRNDSVGSGHYREYFQVVADNIGWMEDYGIYWEVNVP